jgi:hypothetical protein
VAGDDPNIRAALEFSFTEPGEAQAALRITTRLSLYWLARGTTLRTGDGKHARAESPGKVDDPPVARAASHRHPGVVDNHRLVPPKPPGPVVRMP